MSKDILIPNATTNTLEVESSKQYKKHNKPIDDSAIYGNPNATSTPKKSKLKGENITSTHVAETYLTRNNLPRLSICPSKYTPMLYTFRVPSYNNQNINMCKAQSPPFCLLLDNAVAVVWCLFSKITCPKPLGICQLQWALYFLETIKNRRGEHPKDVNICVNAITDQLIELYGDLVNELQSSITPSREQIKKKSSKEVINEAMESKNQTSRKKVGDLTLTESNIDRIVASMPFSLNYSDIMNTSQKSSTVYGVSTTKSGKSMNVQSREQLVSFLSSWKQEQIDKIQAELQRLHSIENYIGNYEKGNFTSSNLGDKEMHVLLEEKNKRNRTA